MNNVLLQVGSRLLFLVLLVMIHVLPIPWGYKIGLTVILILFAFFYPLLRVAHSHLGSSVTTKEDVLAALKVNKWQTVIELREAIAKNKSLRIGKISLVDIASNLGQLASDGIAEGRERYPPEPGWFSTLSNIWEYRRKFN